MPCSNALKLAHLCIDQKSPIKYFGLPISMRSKEIQHDVALLIFSELTEFLKYNGKCFFNVNRKIYKR